MAARVVTDREAIAAFCRRDHIRKLALFGSALQEDYSAASDIDVLVSFDPGHVPGLAFFGMEAEPSEILGHTAACFTTLSAGEARYSWFPRSTTPFVGGKCLLVTSYSWRVVPFLSCSPMLRPQENRFGPAKLSPIPLGPSAVTFWCGLL